jgi:hypothetical protein
MRTVQLTTDTRKHHKNYGNPGVGKTAAQKIGNVYTRADYEERLLAKYQTHLAKKAK